MYSLVMLVAMTAGPDVPQDHLCPVTPSKYGNGFWSKHDFFNCCAPARYGWVTCWTKGFGYFPGGVGGCCTASSVPLYTPSPCACAPCGAGYGGGGKGCGFCGHGWPIGHTPAYYSSVMGCPPHLTAPPYACGTNCKPCCTTQFAFDTGLAGHSHGVGYAGFGGFGNFGFYGAVPMMHKPSTHDLPPFPRQNYLTPSPLSTTPVPMPPIPSGGLPPAVEGSSPKAPEIPPSPEVPAAPDEKDEKKDPKKSRLLRDRPAPATVVLSVPEGSTLQIEGQPVPGSGRERSFRTPDLQPGEEYTYTIRATLMVNGEAVIETRQVAVTAGQVSRASFEKLFARVEVPGRNVADTRTGR